MDKENINRLGFDAWADNKFVNIIEDYDNLMGTGNLRIENDECCIKVYFEEDQITCVIRAYTEDGWKTYERVHKRK